MKKQEKKLTPTEKKTPEALSDEEVSSVAGGATPAVDEGGLVVNATDGPMPQTREHILL